MRRLVLAMLCVAITLGMPLRAAFADQKPAIAIVELEVSDPDKFAKEFFPLAAKVFAEAGATFLVKPSEPAAVDGTPPKRVAIIRFESKEKALATFASTAYRDARKIGDKYATFRIFVTESAAP